MAKQIKDLPSDSTPASGDLIPMQGSDGTKQIDYDKLADAILNKLTSKTYTLDAGTQTLISAVNTLNGRINGKTYNVEVSISLTNEQAVVKEAIKNLYPLITDSGVRNGLMAVKCTDGTIWFTISVRRSLTDSTIVGNVMRFSASVNPTEYMIYYNNNTSESKISTVGYLSSLSTTYKNDIVGAINEINSKVIYEEYSIENQNFSLNPIVVKIGNIVQITSGKVAYLKNELTNNSRVDIGNISNIGCKPSDSVYGCAFVEGKGICTFTVGATGGDVYITNNTGYTIDTTDAIRFSIIYII